MTTEHAPQIGQRRTLTDRAALVTGGGTGIGRAISLQLAALGATVAVHQRDPALADEVVALVRREGGMAFAVQGDLKSRAGCQDVVGSAIAQLGRLDILVNNAAVTGPRAVTPLLTLDDDRMEEIVAVNLLAVLRCAHLAAVQMAEGGVIVNIGSVAGYAAQRDVPVYVATKSALIGLTRSLALDLADRGIRAVHVAPGDIATETSSDDAYVQERQTQAAQRTPPVGRRGTADEVASVVGFLCTDAAAYVTGSSVVVDGGFLTY